MGLSSVPSDAAIGPHFQYSAKLLSYCCWVASSRSRWFLLIRPILYRLIKLQDKNKIVDKNNWHNTFRLLEWKQMQYILHEMP